MLLLLCISLSYLSFQDHLSQWKNKSQNSKQTTLQTLYLPHSLEKV